MRSGSPQTPDPQQTPIGPKLLIVEDDPLMRRAIVRALDDEPYRILETGSADEALATMKNESVHVVLSDHNMPGMTGLDLLRTIRLRYSSVVRMMITAEDSFDLALRAINIGEVSRLLRKPWDDDELRFAVRAGFEQAAQGRELRHLRRQARQQLEELRALEARYPGIAQVRRDKDGAILLEPDLDADGRFLCEALWRDDV